MRLKAKTAFIAGAGRDNGRAIALNLHSTFYLKNAPRAQWSDFTRLRTRKHEPE